MILVRAPLRISFAGGGSDLPAFYNQEPGACFSATISAYMNIMVNRKFDGDVRVSYSKTENIRWARQIEHDIARETLLYCGIERGVEIVSVADVPAGTGLGSSSAYAVALLQALYAYRRGEAGPERIAKDACMVEIDRCKHHIGKQDQYAAAYGGLRLYAFTPEGVTPGLAIMAPWLADHLMLFYLGTTRDSNGLLKEQPIDRPLYHDMADVAHTMDYTARNGKIEEFAKLMDAAWQLKRKVAHIDSDVEDALKAAKKAGALAGKLCGAGGSGFLLLFVPPERQNAVRSVMNYKPRRELRFHFEARGSRIIYGLHRNGTEQRQAVMQPSAQTTYASTQAAYAAD